MTAEYVERIPIFKDPNFVVYIFSFMRFALFHNIHLFNDVVILYKHTHKVEIKELT